MVEVEVFRFRSHTRRDPDDPFKCYDIIDERVVAIPEWFKEYRVVAVDIEPGEYRNDGPLFTVGGSTLGLLAEKDGKLYEVLIKDEYSTVVHSNAAEICTEYGCNLVYACPVKTEKNSVSVEINEISPEEARKRMEYMDRLDHPMTLYEFVKNEVDEIIDELYEEHRETMIEYS